MASRLTLERQGPVAVLTMNNPPLNTLDVPLMREMRDVVNGLTSAAGDARPRAIVLRSAVAGQFSQGIDPKAVLGTDVAGRKQVFLALGELIEALWFGYVPIVADVSGPAFAGGAVLATVADFGIIDAEKGKICFSEVKVGLPLPGFVQRLVKNKINQSAWSDVMLVGRNVDAAEALKVGFSNASYKTPQEREEALGAVVGRIVRLPPMVLRETLRAGRVAERGAFEEFRADLGGFAEFLTDAYLGKGLKAVLAGEAPKF